MIRLFCTLALLALAPGLNAAPTPTAAVAAASAAPLPAPLPLTSAQVMAHLQASIDWYHNVAAIRQLPDLADDVVTRDQLHQTSVTALQLAFDFGHSAAALLSAPSQGANASNAAGSARGLDQAAMRLADRISTLQARLAELNAELARATARTRQTIGAERDAVEGALSLAKEVQGTVQDLQRFAATSTTHGGSSGLAGQVDDLQRSVPEARRGSASSHDAAPTAATVAGTGSAAASSSPGPAAGATPRPQSEGLISLASDWFSIHGTRRQLQQSLDETDVLLKEVDTLRGSLTDEARRLAQLDVGAGTTGDAAQLAAESSQFAAAVVRFKQLSTLLVPLGEQSLAIDSERGVLVQWRSTLAGRSDTVARRLLLRAGVLLAFIGIVLVVSEIWRRATFRYLRDLRRRRQFLALRRVAVGLALTLVVVFGFVSEIGSLATYVGFLTAGIAVALQNVILAVVAYFFLIGRYGVRVGDRITLAGTTGQVLDIGLVRIYLMELTGAELRPSGRMVVISNAVLFQPTALFKQIPGADYQWHTVTLTLDGGSDELAAETRLKSAADNVYEGYRKSIEQQHAAVQRFVDFDTAMPRPEVHVRFVDSGLEYSVRYPVEIGRAAAIDQKMMKALREALAKEPALVLAGSGAPALKPSEV